MEGGDPGTHGVAALSLVDQGPDLDQEVAIILLQTTVDNIVQAQVLLLKIVTQYVVQVKQCDSIKMYKLFTI